MERFSARITILLPIGRQAIHLYPHPWADCSGREFPVRATHLPIPESVNKTTWAAPQRHDFGRDGTYKCTSRSKEVVHD